MKVRTETISKEKDRVKAHLIGEAAGNEDGPIIIAMAGIHGNETTGIPVIEEILSLLKSLQNDFKGRFIGLKGNLSAIHLNMRYKTEDMNRLWKASILDKIRRTDYSQLLSDDRAEIKDLLSILDPIVLKETKNKIIYIDLHTFSGSNGLFCIVPRNNEEEGILDLLAVPLIYGIDQTLRGTSMEYFSEAGHFGFAFETGTHGTPEAAFNALSGLYILLVNMGFVRAEQIPDYLHYEQHLTDITAQLPHKMEFVYKHIIEEGDNFVMKSGFKNFDTIKDGDLLASDRNGEIRALADGFLLMPLYQRQGSDGFFIIREKKGDI